MSYRTFDVRRVAGALGAEVAGVDLRETLDDAMIAEIRRALLGHQVISFPDQHPTPERHLAFGRRFGSLHVHELGPKAPQQRGNPHRSRLAAVKKLV
jgi:taurine dioxygenase